MRTSTPSLSQMLALRQPCAENKAVFHYDRLERSARRWYAKRLKSFNGRAKERFDPTLSRLLDLRRRIRPYIGVAISNSQLPSDLIIPAAQYVRMSTEHQQYSLDNQRLAIQDYANAGGFSVVRTNTDGAKSGVVLKRRNGLRQLLQDVMGGKPGYEAILVYDVSRWGRFQDADEAAHYEFLFTIVPRCLSMMAHCQTC